MMRSHGCKKWGILKKNSWFDHAAGSARREFQIPDIPPPQAVTTKPGWRAAQAGKKLVASNQSAAMIKYRVPVILI